MSEPMTSLEIARLNLNAAMRNPSRPRDTWQHCLEVATERLLNWAEAKERQSLTPEEWQKLRRMLEETQQAALQAQETKPSSPDTEVPADAKTGSDTLSRTYFLAKVEPTGGLRIMGTATQVGPSFIPIPGSGHLALPDEALIPLTRSMWASLSQLGRTQSTTPAAPEVGHTVGGSAMSPDPVLARVWANPADEVYNDPPASPDPVSTPSEEEGR